MENGLQPMRLAEIITEPTAPLPLLYHGTSIAKARSIIGNGLRPRGAKNTFGKSTSFSDKPIGTRHYDRGAILVFAFEPGATMISLQAFQTNGRGDADAVASSPDPTYDEREIAVFNPAAIRFKGWYNKMTQQIDADPPVYPKGFTHSWHH
jgi:hypothetical protein